MGSMRNSALILKRCLSALFGAMALLMLTAGAASAGDKPFTFVALGDMPYGKPEKSTRRSRR